MNKKYFSDEKQVEMLNDKYSEIFLVKMEMWHILFPENKWYFPQDFFLSLYTKEVLTNTWFL